MAFGSFNEGGPSTPMSEINTTPLVDVMLVLLIIFIVTAPLLTHAVPVSLPKAGAGVEAEKPESVTISLNAQGALFWNETPIREGELKAKLLESAQRNPQPELQLRADKDTRYQKIMEIMASAKEAGMEKLSFVSQPETASSHP